MLLPLIQVNSELQDDKVLEERFFGWGSSQTVTVDLEAIHGNWDQNVDVKRVEQNLRSCTNGLIDLLYANDNRLMIAIDDENFEDGQCSMAMRVYASTWESLDCDIPGKDLALWDGWKNRTSPDASRIRDFCKVVRSFEGVQIEPIE